jgi:lipopolysaccharide transport system ATP-binding protein
MSDIALRVEGLGKRYRIGLQESGSGHYKYKSLRDSFSGIARRPLKTLRDNIVPEPMNEENSFWALSDINFEVKKGEVVGIIGRNGAGKSTLLKILSQITKPTTGVVDLFGRVGSLLEVGTGFHPELSGRENIYLNGAVLGMTRAEVKSKFDEIVAFSEIEKFLDTPVKQYSSGMYMRLAFAVAAHLENNILVVDEVLAVGDIEFQNKCLGIMRDVSKSGRTILFVSHNLGTISNLCRTGILLRAGRAEFIGDIADTLEHYLGHHGEGHSKITDRITKCHETVVITDIRVNGSPSHEIDIPSGTQALHIEVSGNLTAPSHIDLEVWMLGAAHNILGFFGPGHENGRSPKRQTGPFSIHHSLQLPQLINRGDYTLSLSLTDHNIQSFLDAPNSVRLNVQGTPTATGRPLEYRDGKGLFRFRSAAKTSP